MKKDVICYWYVIVLIIFPVFCIAQNDLKPPGTYFHIPKLKKEFQDLELAKLRIAEIAKNAKYQMVYDYKNKNNSFYLKEVVFLLDRLEIIRGKQKISIDYSDWADNHRVYLYEVIDPKLVGTFYSVVIGNVVGISFRTLHKEANEFAQHLYSIQHHYVSIKLDKRLEVFKPIAEQYKKLSNKPTISEEQRKLIVQANMMNQQKQYGKAIELYVEAVKLDLVAYPAAYSNIALLQAQISYFDLAIYHMKKYLMLEPDAPDARASQDKIYEWEIMMKEQ